MKNFFQPGKVSMIIDGQFGSTGKGSIAGYIAKHANEVNIVTTNASANAGHWTVMGDEKICLRHLPTVGVLRPETMIYLNAGSIINAEVLIKEIHNYKVDPNRIIIHPNAAIISGKHRVEESFMTNGSTMQGVGAALAEKVIRKAAIAKDIEYFKSHCSALDLNMMMREGAAVLCEVPQGHSLSLLQ